jgi:hypothetical protein
MIRSRCSPNRKSVLWCPRCSQECFIFWVCHAHHKADHHQVRKAEYDAAMRRYNEKHGGQRCASPVERVSRVPAMPDPPTDDELQLIPAPLRVVPTPSPRGASARSADTGALLSRSATAGIMKTAITRIPDVPTTPLPRELVSTVKEISGLVLRNST